MKWTQKRTRLLLVLLLNAVWIATLSIDKELFKFLTPWIVGLINAGYLGVETLRPSLPTGQ